MKFIAVKCPSCNGELQVPDDRDFVKCMYCGVDVKVREATKLKLDVNIPNLFNLAEYSLKSNNFQDAYNYYSKILEYEINNYSAWLGKAESAGCLLTNLSNPDNKEILTCFENAVKYYSGGDVQDFKKKISLIINDNCNSYLLKAINHRNANVNVPNNWENYIAHCKNIIEILDKGLSYDSNNLNILKGIMFICKDNINGFEYVAAGVKGGYKIKKTVSDLYKNELKRKTDSCLLKLKEVNPNQWAIENEKQKASEIDQSLVKKVYIIFPLVGLIIGIILAIIIPAFVNVSKGKNDSFIGAIIYIVIFCPVVAFVIGKLYLIHRKKMTR